MSVQFKRMTCERIASNRIAILYFNFSLLFLFPDENRMNSSALVKRLLDKWQHKQVFN